MQYGNTKGSRARNQLWIRSFIDWSMESPLGHPIPNRIRNNRRSSHPGRHGLIGVVGQRTAQSCKSAVIASDPALTTINRYSIPAPTLNEGCFHLHGRVWVSCQSPRRRVVPMRDRGPAKAGTRLPDSREMR